MAHFDRSARFFFPPKDHDAHIPPVGSPVRQRRAMFVDDRVLGALSPRRTSYTGSSAPQGTLTSTSGPHSLHWEMVTPALRVPKPCFQSRFMPKLR